MLFFEKLKQNRICVLLVLVICIFAGTIYAFKFTPKEYISSSTMMLVKTKNGEEKAGGLELTNNLISTYEEIVRSELTIKEVKNNLKLNVENKELSKKVNLDRVSSSDTFKIEIIDENSDVSKSINEEIIEVFSKKIQEMYGDTEVYIIDTPHIIKTTYSETIIVPIIIGIITGIIINIVYITVLTLIDKRVKKVIDIETDLFLKTLVEIPLKKNKKDNKEIHSELISYESEKSEISKAFKKLRTNIQFLCVNNTANKKVILITSSVKCEGKSYIAANMAVSFAEIGKKVLLLDADMNAGRQNKIFNIPNNLGLSNYLSNLDANGVEINNEFLSKFVNETTIKNLNLITSGTVPPNSSELLTSSRLSDLIKDLKVFYDIVIIDGTSVLSSTDALILARIANSTIIVSNYNKTKKEDIQKTKRDIQNVGGKIIGVILNKVKLRKDKKTRAQRKEEFIKFKLILKDKIKEIQEYIKKKIQDSNQKLLPEYNSVEEKQEKNIIQENKETRDIEKINLEEINKKSKDNTIKMESDILKNIKSNIIGTKNKILDFGKNIFENREKYIKEGLEEDKTVNREALEETKIEEVVDKSEEKDIENIEMNSEDTTENLKEMQNFAKIKESVFGKVKDFKDIGTEKTEILKNAIIEKTQKVKENTANVYSKGKEFCSQKYNDFKELKQKDGIGNDSKESQTSVIEKEMTVEENSEVKNVTENLQNTEILDDSVKNDNTVLVIVDAENGYCRVFSKECFTEKLIRGIDRVDGFPKAHYSSKLVKRRKKYLIDTYKITEKQAERIDTLIYTTLCDYDDCVWIERKMPSDKAEKYVYCMAKEYSKNPEETDKDYNARCQRLRKLELEKAELDIEYKLDNLWKSRKINVLDKISIKKLSNLYEVSSRMKSDTEILKSKKNKKFYTDIIEGAEKKLKNFNNEAKKKEEQIINEDRRVKQEELQLEQEKIEQEKRAAQERIREEQEKIKAEKRAEQEKNRAERKAEQERLRAEQDKNRAEKKKEKEIEKQERKEEAIRKKKEKEKQKVDQRIQKEMVREKQREEAKLEEELLEDNLYPKTKHNKSL